MEPTTLYILIKLADGTERAHEKAFVDVGMCEDYVQNVIKTKPEKGQVLRYECVSLEKMQSAPDWYARVRAPRLIQGVPVDPNLLPRY